MRTATQTASGSPSATEVLTAPPPEVEARYVYAFVPAAAQADLGAIGVGGEAVFLLAGGSAVAAVVSRAGAGPVRPERRKIAAHHEVLRRLLAVGPVLPVTFGTIADNEAELTDLLAHRGRDLQQRLMDLADKVEMGLVLRWEVPDIFEYFVARHPDLRAARDRLFGGAREPTVSQKIELGRFFEQWLEVERQRYARDLEQSLAPHWRQVRFDEPRRETEAVRLACLLERDAREAFDAALAGLAAQLGTELVFDLSGPWVAHHFADLDLGL